jgi:hypothetical protein
LMGAALGRDDATRDAASSSTRQLDSGGREAQAITPESH